MKCIIALGKIEKVDLLKSCYLLETQRFMHFNMLGKRVALQSPALILYRSRTQILMNIERKECTRDLFDGTWWLDLEQNAATSSNVCVESTLINFYQKQQLKQNKFKCIATREHSK